MNIQHALSPALLASAVLATLAAATPAQAQTVRGARTTTAVGTTKVAPVMRDTTTTTTAATSPVGFITKSCLANTDTNLTIPFTRPPTFVGAATGGTNSATTTGTITFSGTPFTASAYKYVQGTQSTHYYAYVTGGAKEGAIYDITDNTANSLTVNTNGDAISSLGSGTQVRVIPHWTLATALTLGQSVVGSSTFGGTAPTQILVPDQSTPGTDLAAGAIYYYYTGTAAGGAGWRKVGGAVATIADDTILYPETFFVLRNNTANALSFVPTGSVSTLATAVTSGSTQTVGVNIATVIDTLQANTDQDNAVALPVAVDTTLSGSNLYQSGAFTGSTSFSGSGDQLLVYDNTVSGTDKAATKIYYYYTGTAAGGAGWRQQGDAVATLHNSDALPTGVGFVLRKRGTTTPQTVVWNYRPIIAP